MSTDSAAARKRAKRIQWGKCNPQAERYMAGKLADYQALPVSDRSEWLRPVQEHIVSTWTDIWARNNHTAGDVRNVSAPSPPPHTPHSTSLCKCTLPAGRCNLVQKKNKQKGRRGGPTHPPPGQPLPQEAVFPQTISKSSVGI